MPDMRAGDDDGFPDDPPSAAPLRHGMSAPVEPTTRRRALRGRMASLSGNPFLAEGCLDHIEDALILIEDGRIAAVGPMPRRWAKSRRASRWSITRTR